MNAYKQYAEGPPKAQCLMNSFRTLCILLLGSFLVASCGKNQTAATEEPLRPVYYAKVKETSGAEMHTFSGTAQSETETTLSFQVGGILNQLPVELGDRVRKGTLVAAIDPVDLNIQANQAVAQAKGSDAQYISAEAQIKSAQTVLINARSNYERIENLYANNSVSLAEFEAAKSNYETAEAQYEAALANLEAASSQVSASAEQVNSARNQIAYTRLSAPFDGIVTNVMVEENELVSPGTPIVSLGAESAPEVKVGIPDVVISKVRPSQEVSIVFSSLPGQNFSGVVKEVAYATGSAPTYPVIVSLLNYSENIRPGMAANVTFSFDSQNSSGVNHLSVPPSSVAEGPGGAFVYVLKPNGESYQVEKRPVEVGALNSVGMEIMSGLQKDEIVATAGLNTLLAGMQVSLLED